MLLLLSLLLSYFGLSLGCSDKAKCIIISAECGAICACDFPSCECCPECMLCVSKVLGDCCDCLFPGWSGCNDINITLSTINTINKINKINTITTKTNTCQDSCTKMCCTAGCGSICCPEGKSAICDCNYQNQAECYCARGAKSINKNVTKSDDQTCNACIAADCKKGYSTTCCKQNVTAYSSCNNNLPVTGCAV